MSVSPLLNLPSEPLSNLLLAAGKKSLAMEAFARALRQLPTIICDNAGLDSAEIVATLRAAHGADPAGTRMGVDVIAGGAGDMSQLGIFESFKVKQQVRMSSSSVRSCCRMYILPHVLSCKAGVIVMSSVVDMLCQSCGNAQCMSAA